MKRKDGDQYLLQDGTYADPKDCSAGKDGVMRHKNGVGVAMNEDGEPMTLSAVAEINKDVAVPVDERQDPVEPSAADANAKSAKSE